MLNRAKHLPGGLRSWLIIISLGLLIGCGTGGLTDATAPAASQTGTGGATGTGDTSVGVTPASLSLSSGAPAIKAGNQDATTITITVLDGNNAVVPNLPISFSSDKGIISAASVTTDEAGRATVTLRSGSVQSDDAIWVTATAGKLSSTMKVTVVGSTLPATINLLASPLSIKPKNKETAAVTAIVLDVSNTPVKDQSVTFSVSGGQLSSASAITDSTGQAQVTLSSGVIENSAITITAAAAGLSTTATVTVLPDSTKSASISVSALPISVKAGNQETSTVKAKILNGSDAPVPNETVTFSASGGLLNGGATPVNAATDANGEARVALSSGTLSSGATVTVTVTAAGGLSSAVQVAIAGSTKPASMTIMASPLSIKAGGQETSTISAAVLDSDSAPITNQLVTFSSTGGQLSSGSAVTNDQGKAIVTLSPGAVASGAITVTGSIPDFSSSVTVTVTGSAEAASIRLSASPVSIRAGNQETSLITATVLDANNAVVPNLPVSFSADKGIISAASVITDGAGQAKVTLSSGSVAAGGSITVTGTASGLSATVAVNVAGATVPASINLVASPNSIQSGNVETSTITATVLDDNFAPVINQTVLFGANGGQISAGSATTDDKGQAKITLSSGATTSGVVTVTGAIAGLSSSVGITIAQAIQASSIMLTASPVSVKSGNLETSTITATVLDASNAAIKDLSVTFSSSGGQMSASSALTDAKGEARIAFSSGTIDPRNQVITITGSASGLSSSVPVSITGSTLTASTDKTNITDDTGTEKATLTVTAKDGSGMAIYNTPISFTVSGLGGATLSISGSGEAGQTSLTSNTSPVGQISLIVTGVTAGAVTVTATGLGASVAQDYTVSSPGSLFSISDPSDDPYAMTTNTDLTVTANAPAGVNTVRFATTMGFLDGVPNQQVVDKPVAGGTASVVFRSSLAGLATIQASDYDHPSTSDSLGVVVYAPAADAGSITLQSTLSSLPASSGGAQNSTKLTAVVRTGDGGQVVGNAPVSFSIVNPTGGGETISPVIVYTDNAGVATTTFTSGALPSGQTESSVTVKATALSGTEPTASTSIVIRSIPGSVAVGRGSVVLIPDNTTYQLPMSVQVADANGSPPPAGTIVSLRLWAYGYSTGFWYDIDIDPDKDNFVPYVAGTFPYEDVNEDMYMNVGEDTNLNGQLDPPNSAAGTVPATVTTDQYGVGTFNVTYLKQSAVWILVRLQASTLVQGTETMQDYYFRLPAEKSEAKSGVLPASSYDLELVTTGAPPTATYPLPFFNSTVATYTTSSTLSSIPPAGGNYTFTAPAGAQSGTLYNDTITIQDMYLGTFLVPVKIRIQ